MQKEKRVQTIFSGRSKTPSFCFTLIELLVVVGIIAILAALLFPALAKAKEMATRAVCMADRKQNGVSIFNYATDFDGRIPSATAMRDANGYNGLEPSKQIHWHGATTATSPAADWAPQASQTHEGTGVDNSTVFALGTLARLNYAGNGSLLVCPGLDRNISTRPKGATVDASMVHYNEKSMYLDTCSAKCWSTMIKGELSPIASCFRHYTGVFHQFWSKGSWGAYGSKDGIRIDWIAREWQKSDDVSSILLACAQFDFYNHSQAVGDECLSNSFGSSHKAKGNNALFYDGSARWTPVTEVMADGWQATTAVGTGYSWMGSLPKVWLFNRTGTHDGAADNYVMWGRKKAFPGAVR